MRVDLRGRWLVVAAVAMALLSLSAQPVAAANVAIVSEHSTASEFNEGSLTNAEVERTGESAYVAPGVSDQSIAGRWSLDEGNGDGAQDRVQTNDVDIDDSDWVSGISGSALSVDGSQDLSTGYVPQSTERTLSFWVKVEDDQSGGLGVHDAGDARFYVDINNGNWRHANGDSTATTDEDAKTGVWQHITLVADGSTSTLFINGTEVDSFQYSESETNSDVFRLASRSYNGGPSQEINGTIDEVRVYESALSDGDVEDLYAEPSGKLRTTSEDSSYSNVHDVDRSVSGSVNLSLNNATAQVTWQGSTDGGDTWTTLNETNVSSPQELTSTWSEFEGDDVRVAVDMETTDSDHVARIHSDSVSAQTTDPIIDESSASPNETTSGDGELSISVSDPDFATSQGDEVTVDFHDASDDSVIGTDTLSANGSASTTWDGLTAGENEWYVTVEDSYGNSLQSSSFSFGTPEELEIRNETAPEELISGDATVTLRFYGDDTVVERTTTDGKIDMAGLPVDEELVVVANADGYYQRRIIIDSLFDQQRVFLLDENESAVLNEFSVADQTGQFPADSSRIYIEKAVSINDSAEWVVIAGDYVGASQFFPVYLQRDARYRLSVQNSDGDTRQLGSYLATSEGTRQLEVGRIEWRAPEGDQFRWEAFITEEDVIKLHYEDQQNETSNFEVTVHERGNESNVLFSDSENELGSYLHEEQLSESDADKQWVVKWSATRNGEEIGNTNQLGGVENLDLPIDSRWLSLGALVLIVLVAALFPSSEARTGAIVIVAIATGMTWLGWVDIPMSAIGIAGAIALLGKVSEFGGARA
ncbi:LamG-like jellyroll fold domain-containing protein [Haloprofundus halobius]|uniref:LamG-like jellyroll fold domain-containing protein n=1 Tax=Haloprofundus halobius TaxID=2876194 RepID=UPI001CCD51E8|nr:LamG-like jellyroll fold domain-containing protein [Haloprofundus halobius]